MCNVECIQVDDGAEDGENFLDIVDNFDGMSDDDDEDVSFVSMGGIDGTTHHSDLATYADWARSALNL